MRTELDSIKGLCLASVPNFYISKDAAEMLLGASIEVAEEGDWSAEGSVRSLKFADVFDIEDPRERCQTLLELVKECDCVALTRVNGLAVIAIPEPGAKKVMDRKEAVDKINKQYGIPKEYARALYRAFGNSAFDIGKEVLAYMHMTENHIANRPFSIADRIITAEKTEPKQTEDVSQAADNAAQSKTGSRTQRRYANILMMPLNRADEPEIRGILEEYGIDTGSVDIEKVLWVMNTGAIDPTELRATLKKRQEIGYIAREYEASQEVAESAHAMLTAETEGMLDLDVLKEMDLSILVRELRNEIDVREAIAAKKPYLDGNDAVLRVADLPTEEQRQCYFQLVGTDHKTARDYAMAREDID